MKLPDFSLFGWLWKRRAKKTMNDYFGLLYARPSFVEGWGRVLDIGGTMTEYNASLTGEQADLLALRADLRALRNDWEEAQKQAHAPSLPKSSTTDDD